MTTINLTFTGSSAPGIGANGSTQVTASTTAITGASNGDTITWDPKSASGVTWPGTTYIMAIVLASSTTTTPLASATFEMNSATSQSLKRTPGWTPPANSQPNTDVLFLAKNGDWTLKLKSVPSTAKTYNYVVYFFTVDKGVWYASKSLSVTSAAS